MPKRLLTLPGHVTIDPASIIAIGAQSSVAQRPSIRPTPYGVPLAPGFGPFCAELEPAPRCYATVVRFSDDDGLAIPTLTLAEAQELRDAIYEQVRALIDDSPFFLTLINGDKIRYDAIAGFTLDDTPAEDHPYNHLPSLIVRLYRPRGGTSPYRAQFDHAEAARGAYVAALEAFSAATPGGVVHAVVADPPSEPVHQLVAGLHRFLQHDVSALDRPLGHFMGPALPKLDLTADALPLAPALRARVTRLCQLASRALFTRDGLVNHAHCAYLTAQGFPTVVPDAATDQRIEIAIQNAIIYVTATPAVRR